MYGGSFNVGTVEAGRIGRGIGTTGDYLHGTGQRTGRLTIFANRMIHLVSGRKRSLRKFFGQIRFILISNAVGFHMIVGPVLRYRGYVVTSYRRSCLCRIISIRGFACGGCECRL